MAEEIGILRRAIAKIEGVPARCGHKMRVRLGADDEPAFSLDLAFGGGLPTGALYEIVPARANDMAAATGFSLALAVRLCQARTGAIVWIAQDFQSPEFATLYGPGLAAHGLDLGRLILIQVATGRDLVWAMAEALKCPACVAVIGEFWSSRPQIELPVALRLLRGARSSAAAGLLLLHQDIDFTYQIFSRLEVGGTPVRPPPNRMPSHRKPLPACPTWAVRVLKAQAMAGQSSGIDPDIVRPVLWNPQGAFFRDALPFPLARELGDRSRYRAQIA
jgi:protein ImuA